MCMAIGPERGPPAVLSRLDRVAQRLRHLLRLLDLAPLPAPARCKQRAGVPSSQGDSLKPRNATADERDFVIPSSWWKLHRGLAQRAPPRRCQGLDQSWSLRSVATQKFPGGPDCCWTVGPAVQRLSCQWAAARDSTPRVEPALPMTCVADRHRSIHRSRITTRSSVGRERANTTQQGRDVPFAARPWGSADIAPSTDFT
jgi:hypothetical protein